METLKRLLQEFSEFARFPAPRLSPCALGEIVADLRTLYARDVEEGRLRFEVGTEALEVSADRGQLRQALINLLVNARDAAGATGRVTVTAARSGSKALLTVSDTGPGLSAEARERLFVPGFTTKATGSGIGLTIVERVVNEHGGSVTVESSPASGTAFHIHLPLLRGA